MKYTSPQANLNGDNKSELQLTGEDGTVNPKIGSTSVGGGLKGTGVGPAALQVVSNQEAMKDMLSYNSKANNLVGTPGMKISNLDIHGNN